MFMRSYYFMSEIHSDTDRTRTRTLVFKIVASNANYSAIADAESKPSYLYEENLIYYEKIFFYSRSLAKLLLVSPELKVFLPKSVHLRFQNMNQNKWSCNFC